MERGRILACIDVGTSKVCTILAEVSAGAILRVLGVNVVPSRGIQKAIVLNMGEATEAIRESVVGMERNTGLGVKSAYVGISGQHIKAFNSRATIGINNRHHVVTEKAIKKVVEASKGIELPKDRKILHAIPRYFTLDGQPGIENPLGMHGYRLDVETHIITAGIAFVLNLVKCVQGAGVDIMELVSEPLADSEAILELGEKAAGVLLLDIGDGTSDVTVFKKGDIWYTSALPVAGYQLTKDLSLGLGIPFNVAEGLKKKHGNVMPDDELRGEVISLGGRRSVPYEEFCHIIGVRAEEIFKLILAELSQAELKEEELSNLVLCGGSANLAGIDALAQEIIGLPTRVAHPKGVPQAAGLEDPAYATAVGLLLWGSKQAEAKPPPLGELLRHFFLRLARLFSVRRTRY